ncbi:hypothetical protein LTR10_011910 [Elasticomyces elasticus]|nr:hypothetical protein LTR10_011910 [Elasticomyces elasticus]KAK4968853.1 hypothetical protein LTR42_009131 [Elasticomyces elasticus]
MRVPADQPPKVKEAERPKVGTLRPKETAKRTAKGAIHMKREKKKVAKSKAQQPAAKKSRRSPEKNQDKAAVTKPSNKEVETAKRLSIADQPVEDAAKPEAESNVEPSVIVKQAETDKKAPIRRTSTPPLTADSDSYVRRTPVRLAKRNMDVNGEVDDTRDEVHSKDGPVKNAKDFRMTRWAEQTTKEAGDPTIV